RDRDGEAALINAQGIDLPATHDAIQPAAVIQEFLAFAERQFVAATHIETMRCIEAREAIFTRQVVGVQRPPPNTSVEVALPNYIVEHFAERVRSQEADPF